VVLNSTTAEADVASPKPARRLRSPVERRALGLLAVALLVLVLFFYAPLITLLVRSFRAEPGQGPMSAYKAALTGGELATTLQQSFEIAGISFALMLLLGYPLAYLICFRTKPKWQMPILLLLVMSGGVSDIVRIFAWYALLGYNGVINRGLISAGLVNQPVGSLLFSRLAVVIVLTSGWLPYVVIPIYSAMRTIEPSHLEAARDLYSGRFSAFRNVVLPMSAPGVLGAFIIVFVPVLSDFATPQLVGGPTSLMIGNFVSDELLQIGDFSAAAAGATLLLLVSIVLIVLAQRLTRRIYGR
jgi:spermidine/putrescine transport system permease protein